MWVLVRQTTEGFVMALTRGFATLVGLTSRQGGATGFARKEAKLANMAKEDK